MANSNPFYPYRNCILDFEVESDDSDTEDLAGNPQPSTKVVRVEAFMKPSKRTYGDNYSDYSNLGESDVIIEGFVVSPRVFPEVGLLAKTVYAKYRDQEGEFTRMVKLQSTVKAELVTGYAIKGIFRVIGGQ